MKNSEIVTELTKQNLRIALNEAALERIDDQVTNHIPTAISEVHQRVDDFHERLDKLYDRVWKVTLALSVIGGGAYGIIEKVT